MIERQNAGRSSLRVEGGVEFRKRYRSVVSAVKHQRAPMWKLAAFKQLNQQIAY